MVIGLIICSLFCIALGALGYKEYLKWCERKSDERCNRIYLDRAYKTNIDNNKIIEPEKTEQMKDTVQQNLDYFFHYLNIGKDANTKENGKTL